MQDELQQEYLDPFQIWASLQEAILKKREIRVWLDFYKERLEHEQENLVIYREKEKILQSALERRISAKELSKLKTVSFNITE